jgi:hypothetical protein
MSMPAFLLLFPSLIGGFSNHCSHLRPLIWVFFCPSPITAAARAHLPGREKECSIRSAIPNPPWALNAPASDSDANSPRAPACASEPSANSALEWFNGATNSFNIKASN